MKAKIISTGEIINIADYARVTLDKCDDYGIPIEVSLEDVELIKDDSITNDWQQIRIQAAIAAMQGILANQSSVVVRDEVLIRESVSLADALVERLKEE